MINTYVVTVGPRIVHIFVAKIFACYWKPRYLRTQKTTLFETTILLLTDHVEFKKQRYFIYNIEYF